MFYEDESEITAVMEVEKDLERKFGNNKRKRYEDKDEEWNRNQRLVKLSSKLLVAQSKVSHLELELSSANDKLQAQDIKHQRNLDSITNKHNIERRKDEDGRMEAKRLVDEYKGLKDENDGLREQVKELKVSLLNVERRELKNKVEKQNQFDEEKESWEMERTDLMRECDKMKREDAILREERTELEKRVDVLTRRVEKMKGWEGKVHGLQHRLTIAKYNLSVAKLETSRSGVGGSVACKVEMEARIEKLQKEVEYHKSLRDNDSLLYERLNSSEAKIHRLSCRNKEMENLAEENKKLKKKMTVFIDMMKNIPNVKTPNDVVVLVDDLLSKGQVMNDQKASLNSSLNERQWEKERLEGEIDRLTSKLHKQQHDNHLLTNNNTKLQNKVAILSMEKDSYVSELETSLSINNDPSEKLKIMKERLRISDEIKRCMENELTTSTTDRARLMTKVEELQERLKKEESKNNYPLQQQQQQKSQHQQQQSQQQQPSVDNQEVVDLRLKVTELEGKMFEMEEEKEKLVYEVERGGRMGHYNRTTIKVITLVENPFSMIRRTLASECQSSKQENQLLKTKLKLAKEGSEDLTVRSNQMIASIGTVQEHEKLKEELNNARLSTQRLKETYEEGIHGYKHLISTLLGYHVQKVAKKTFTVVSSYSDHPQHFFLFKETNEGDFQLMCNDFLKDNFSDLLESHITSSSSYPYFMAAATLRLRERSSSSFLSSSSLQQSINT